MTDLNTATTDSREFSGVPEPGPSLKAPLRHTFRVCRAERCAANGSEKLVEHLEQRLGVEIGKSTPAGRFALSPIYCLGNCARSPAVMLDETVYGCVTTEFADFLIEELQRREKAIASDQLRGGTIKEMFEPIIHNANEIARHFRNFPREAAIEGIRDHIERFWDRGMKEQLLAQVGQGGQDLDELVREAVRRMPVDA